MTNTCCPACRLRFSPAGSAYLPACPSCGQSLEALRPEDGLGYRLFRLEDSPAVLPDAIAVSLPVPDPER